MFAKLKKTMKAEDGVAALEFSILITPFMIIMLSATQLGHFAATSSELVRMSSEAVRIMSIEPGIEVSTLKARLERRFVFLIDTEMTITRTQASLAGHIVERLHFSYTHHGADFPLPFNNIGMTETVYVP